MLHVRLSISSCLSLDLEIRDEQCVAARFELAFLNGV